jgi:hypothetical protein
LDKAKQAAEEVLDKARDAASNAPEQQSEIGETPPTPGFAKRRP